MKKSTLISTISTALIIYSVSFSAAAGNVTSISQPTQRETVGGSSYKEVAVTCSQVSAPRFIRKQQGVVGWCSELAATLCASGKLAAAKKVCSSRYNAAVEDSVLTGASQNNSSSESESSNQGKAAAADQQERNEDQISREREKLRLQQQELDLRRKKLESRRRTLELEGAEG